MSRPVMEYGGSPGCYLFYFGVLALNARDVGTQSSTSCLYRYDSIFSIHIKVLEVLSRLMLEL